ncbi:SET domain-containing protein SmydA-8-like [Topomyia yanbarensis]|uniref:SET domain-containing protein SmydA-8-like n=1 Tax=Topomyia yanbarensis TaxID=2498891 RepID=UPI00273C6F4D|nr:SET domain-containing protein SmydA-8-like [Topomyia yanbarensis]
MSDEVCAVCGIPAGRKCGGCQQVTYCNQDHQRQHWKATHRNECRSYKISHDPVLGRHLTATRTIQRGEIIYRDSPLLLGPKIGSVPVCLGCHRNLIPLLDDGEKTKTLYTCRRCGWPLCSESCEYSPAHAEECQLFSSRAYRSQIKFNEREPERKESAYCVIVPLRAILLRRKNPSKYATMLTFESHLETRRTTPLYAVMKSNLVPFIRNVLGLRDIQEEEILQLCGILDTNSYEIRVPEQGIKIRALFEVGAMMSHSCRPNTKHYFDEKLNMVLVAAVDIPKNDVISVSYSQPLQPTIQRRYIIKLAKCFECSCERCQDPTEFQTFASSIDCPKCNKAKIVSIDPLDFRSAWQCQNGHCSYRESYRQYVTRNEAIQAEIMALSKGSPVEYERFLETHQSVLHSWNTNVLQVKYALCEMYGGKLGGQMMGDLSEDQLRRQVDLCTDLLEVADRFEPGQSVFRGKLLLNLRNALLLLREKLGLQFDSNVIQLPQNGQDSIKPCARKGRKVASDKQTPTEQPSSTFKQQLERVQRELEEMIKSDPTFGKQHL